MKKSLAFVTLVASCGSVHSWQPAAIAPVHRCHTTLAAAKETEEYLNKLWKEEKLVERDLVVQEIAIEEKDAEDVTKHLVSEMLETALEHVKTMEKDAAHHAKEANEAFDRALQKERVLEEFVEEDEELPPIPIDDYLKSRLHQAEEEEMQALKAEDEYVHQYEDLREKERSIKDLLEQMKKLGM